MKKTLTLCVAIGLLLCIPNAFAYTVVWTDWTSATSSPDTVTGNMGPVTAAYSGDYSFVQLGTGTNYWTEGTPKPYTGNSVVDNAPTPAEMIALYPATTNKITFSQAIENPIMAIVSQGAPWNPVVYDFDRPFTLLSEGQGYWGDGTYTIDSVNYVLTGVELHGVIQFSGLISEINWTSTAENWHGFTFGSVPVPEPATMLLLGSGLIGLAGIKRHYRKN
ncbi:MAG: PEP-CTERM sorting domain-containing protein [Thermodesulfobacteriota bacterium]